MTTYLVDESDERLTSDDTLFDLIVEADTPDPRQQLMGQICISLLLALLPLI